MTIGFVLANPPGYSETFLVNKIRGLQENGYSVALFVDKPSPAFKLCAQYAAPGVPASGWLRLLKVGFYTVYFRLFYATIYHQFIKAEQAAGRSTTEGFKNLYRSMHLLKTRQLDWVHFGFATMAVGRENVAAVLGARMAVSFRGYDISIYPVKHPGCYNLLWQKVNKVHTISNDLLEIAYKLGLSHQTPVCKITPAIDINYFFTNTVKSTFHHPVQILTVARLHWKKGLEYTLQALSMLKQQDVQFRYTIIGEGEEYERLAFAAYQMGVKDWVTFAGKVPHEQVKTYYEQSDIYIQYSIQEGFCNAVLEAQAVGLLCVVSDAEGLSENVLHEETGWVVPKRNSAFLMQQLLKIIYLPNEKRQETSQRAMRRVKTEFSLTRQQQAFSAFYQESEF
jgi:colanic acid/amylovoran biosynthesis glycosyltransferase